MKKFLSVFLAFILVVVLSVSALAYSDGDLIAEELAGTSDIDYDESDDIYEYWLDNGFPDYVSYIYEYGGEMWDDGMVLRYWEIGIVGADEELEEIMEEILSEMAVYDFVDFYRCDYSYNERETALEAILALDDKNIEDVFMGSNTEYVYVVLSDSLSNSKRTEYAEKLSEEYGGFVVILDAEAVSTGNLESSEAETSAASDVGNIVLLIVILAAATVLLAVLIRRNHASTASAQTTTGGTVSVHSTFSKKEVIAAVRNSSASPRNDAFREILSACEKIQK